MLDISAQKNELRKFFKNKRSKLDPKIAKKLSSEIAQNFITNLLPKINFQQKQDSFSLYIAANNEVSTSEIAQHFYDEKIKFSYPKITKKHHPLSFIEAEIGQKFLENKFYKNIQEPEFGKEIFPNFVILPLVAFDSNLSRLGMGGGFFDRSLEFLKSKNSKIITIGLAYDFQRFEANLPNDKNDQRLDFIVTEKLLFTPKPDLR